MLLLLLGAAPCPAQRIVQYQHVLPLVNPSAMGEYKAAGIGLIGQYGLVGFDGAPQTAAMSATIPFSIQSAVGNQKLTRGGYRQAEAGKSSYIGLTAVGSRVGVHRRIYALAGYGHRIHLGEAAQLTLAFTSGARVQSASYAEAANEYVVDPAMVQRMEGSAAASAFAWQVGAYLHGGGYYLSAFAAQTAAAAEYCFQAGWRSRRERGWNIDLSTVGIFCPKSEFGQKYQQDINLMLRYNEGVSVGASWRSKKDVAGMGSVRLGQLRLGYAYQIFNFDQLLPTHEVMLKYSFGGGRREREDRY